MGRERGMDLGGVWGGMGIMIKVHCKKSSKDQMKQNQPFSILPLLFIF